MSNPEDIRKAQLAEFLKAKELKRQPSRPKSTDNSSEIAASESNISDTELQMEDEMELRQAVKEPKLILPKPAVMPAGSNYVKPRAMPLGRPKKNAFDQVPLPGIQPIELPKKILVPPNRAAAIKNIVNKKPVTKKSPAKNGAQNERMSPLKQALLFVAQNEFETIKNEPHVRAVHTIVQDKENATESNLQKSELKDTVDLFKLDSKPVKKLLTSFKTLKITGLDGKVDFETVEPQRFNWFKLEQAENLVDSNPKLATLILDVLSVKNQVKCRDQSLNSKYWILRSQLASSQEEALKWIKQGRQVFDSAELESLEKSYFSFDQDIQMEEEAPKQNVVTPTQALKEKPRTPLANVTTAMSATKNTPIRRSGRTPRANQQDTVMVVKVVTPTTLKEKTPTLIQPSTPEVFKQSEPITAQPKTPIIVQTTPQINSNEQMINVIQTAPLAVEQKTPAAVNSKDRIDHVIPAVQQNIPEASISQEISVHSIPAESTPRPTRSPSISNLKTVTPKSRATPKAKLTPAPRTPRNITSIAPKSGRVTRSSSKLSVVQNADSELEQTPLRDAKPIDLADEFMLDDEKLPVLLDFNTPVASAMTQDLGLQENVVSQAKQSAEVPSFTTGDVVSSVAPINTQLTPETQHIPSQEIEENVPLIDDSIDYLLDNEPVLESEAITDYFNKQSSVRKIVQMVGETYKASPSTPSRKKPQIAQEPQLGASITVLAELKSSQKGKLEHGSDTFLTPVKRSSRLLKNSELAEADVLDENFLVLPNPSVAMSKGMQIIRPKKRKAAFSDNGSPMPASPAEKRRKL